ncbi:hypothetical protein PIB30_088001 [Stylosanthes scabra]|uniref:Uncharacterized protein n=1 Tax=Stylosanthes scabra TaxID=79078 RepID=A0ABU6YSJ6_9FABA|nr:hypothetical protein [Stylosanthes scabra]
MEELLAGHSDPLLMRFKTFAIRFDEQASKSKEWFRKIERRFGRNSDIYKSVIDLKHVIGFTELYERLWLLLEGHEDLFMEYVDLSVQLHSIPI